MIETNTYNLHCEFDIERHKATYYNYLEVIIHPDGKIEYAVPSHQEKLIKVMMDKFNITRQEVSLQCPRDMWADFAQWLCNMTGCISVWTDYAIYPEGPLQYDQLMSLKRLQEAQIFRGNIQNAQNA